MLEFNFIGKLFIIIGIIMIIVGAIFLFGSKIPFLGRLPGDITIEKKNFGFYFPITTCIIISIIISFLMWLFSKK